jgi:hypothetical protein
VENRQAVCAPALLRPSSAAMAHESVLIGRVKLNRAPPRLDSLSAGCDRRAPHRGPLRCGARAGVRRQRLGCGPAHIFQALLKHDAPLLFLDITYSFYPVYCS